MQILRFYTISPQKRCHGEKGNVVYEMAKDKNVLEHSNEGDILAAFVRSDGEGAPSELSKKLWNFNFKLYESPENDDEKTAYIGPYGNYFAKK